MYGYRVSNIVYVRACTVHGNRYWIHKIIRRRRRVQLNKDQYKENHRLTLVSLSHSPIYVSSSESGPACSTRVLLLVCPLQ